MKSLALTLALLCGLAAGQEQTPAQLKAQCAALKAADVPWRRIAWKNCLIEGLAASRAAHKPVILWVFIDRPVDDQRC